METKLHMIVRGAAMRRIERTAGPWVWTGRLATVSESMANGMVREGTPHVRHGMRAAKFATHAMACSCESEMTTIGMREWGVPQAADAV